MFVGFPDAMLVKLRFGLCRNDEFTGDEAALKDQQAKFLDAMNFDDLVSVGYGKDRFAVMRRLNRALAALRVRLVAAFSKRGIVNISG